MSDVKRYRIGGRGLLPASAAVFLPDEVVNATDYDALLAENERLKLAAQTNWNEFAENVGEADKLRAELAAIRGREPVGKLLVSAEPLRKVLGALVGAPHHIRELQATRSPPELFADNPINVLIKELNAAQGGDA